MPGSKPVTSGALNRRDLLAGSTSVLAAAGAVKAVQSRGLSGPLRVVQIGVQGHWGEIMRDIPRAQDCRLVAVARSQPGEDLSALQSRPAWNDEVRIYDDYRQMLEEVRPHLVATFMPYGLNGQANIAAARQGCHIISEKPLAGTLGELQTLRQERDRAGVRITALLGMRLAPALAAARRAVADGLIGEPVLISAQKSYRWGTNRPEFYKQRRTYGGSIPWVAIHAIDFIRFVTGLEYAEVTARQAVKVHQDYPGCEDCGALLFGMTNGGHATLTFDFLRPAKADSHGDDRLRVVGSKGIVEVRLAGKGTCELVTNEEELTSVPLPDSGRSQFLDFVAEIRGGPQHFLAPDDAFRATEVALKARSAADEGRTVKL